MSHRSVFVRRVRNVRDVLQAVCPRTEAQWLDTLTRQTDPQAALANWETIAFAFEAFFEARTPTRKSRHQALQVLMDCSAGHSEAEIHKAAYKALSIAEIKRLIAHFSAAEHAIASIDRGRKAR